MGIKEGQISYISSIICEEFIKLLSDRVKAKTTAEIKKAKYYSISIDTPDIAHIDQLSIVIRYVRIDGQPVERFLAFIDIEKHEGKYLFETLKSFIDECGIKLEDCRGQTCDNASNMSGTYSGVQARFHQVKTLAEWVPCAAHSLNLVWTAAAKSCIDAVRFFCIVQRLYTFLSAWWSKLLENLPKQSPVGKSLSETRWSARADAVKALASNYKVIQNSVDAIARTSTQPPLVVLEAKSLVSKLSSLNTVLMCIVWNNILDTLNRVNKALQAPGIEIGSVVIHYRNLLEHIRSLRDSERFDRFENEAKSIAPGLGYDDKNTRAKKRELFYDEIPEEVKVNDCRENFRVNTYLVIIDILLSETEGRLHECL